jgi:hypothetical protein
VSSLRACPFCRELYDESEAERCKVCGVLLRPLHELPPSFESRQREAERWSEAHPLDRPLRWNDLAHGKGWLLGASVLGLFCFFAPWVSIAQPDETVLSGFDLAGRRGFWFSAGAIGWFVNVPLVLSRRTINQMRGIRVTAALFAGLTAAQALLLWSLAPAPSILVVDYHWAWGFHASALVSVVGAVLGLRLGGRAAADPQPRAGGTDEPTNTDGRTVH